MIQYTCSRTGGGHENIEDLDLGPPSSVLIRNRQNTKINPDLDNGESAKIAILKRLFDQDL